MLCVKFEAQCYILRSEQEFCYGQEKAFKKIFSLCPVSLADSVLPVEEVCQKAVVEITAIVSE